MIGLKRHTVKIVEHDPDWINFARNVCQQLWHEIGDLCDDIQHVGSTAVPGLPAKPIVDIAASVHTNEVIPQLVERLTRVSYIYRGDAKDRGGFLFVKETSPDVRTIHLHVVEKDEPQWKNYIRFRDLLRSDLEIRKKYADLKQKLVLDYPKDRTSYTASKDEFIREVLRIHTEKKQDLPEFGGI